MLYVIIMTNHVKMSQKIPKTSVKKGRVFITIAFSMLCLNVFSITPPAGAGDKTYTQSEQVILDVIKPYSYLHTDILTLENSQRKKLIIHHDAKNAIPGHVSLWLIRQQKNQTATVVCNQNNEFFITESDAYSLVRKGKLEKIMQEELMPSSVFNLNGMKGKVLVQFLVNESGEVEKINATINNESLNAFQRKILFEASRRGVLATSGYWKPAVVAGSAVKKWKNLPVYFEFKKNRTIVKL